MTGIFAVGINGEFANEGKLLEMIKEDLNFFKKTTTDNIVVMGRKTWDSLPKKLPNRENWVVSSKLEQNFKPNGLPDLVFANLEDVIEMVNHTNKKVFVIGGKQLLESLIDKMDTLIITTFPKAYEADTVLDLGPLLTGFKKRTGIKQPVEGELGYILINTWTR